MPDHIHLLISIPSTLSIAKAMQLSKGNPSKWIHETFPENRSFEWQSCYGAFSIGYAELQRTIDYKNNQPKHHQTRNFEQEYLVFVERNGLKYDERCF